jgi:hypothetical protein
VARIQSCRTSVRIGGPTNIRQAASDALRCCKILAPGSHSSFIPRLYPLWGFRWGPSKILSRARQPKSIASSSSTLKSRISSGNFLPWRRALLQHTIPLSTATRYVPVSIDYRKRCFFSRPRIFGGYSGLCRPSASMRAPRPSSILSIIAVEFV